MNLNWRVALSLLLPVVVGCLATTNGPGEGEIIPDGSPGDSGGVPPDGSNPQPKGSCRFTHNPDGDTLHCTDHRGRDRDIRMLGINSSEVRKNQYCSGTARNALNSLLRGQLLRIDGDENAGEDPHGRELGYVSLWGSSTEGAINLEMLKKGWACLYRRYVPGLRLESALREAAREAEQTRAGCWEGHPSFCK